MRTYYLLVHPVYGQKIQKIGFSFWGFLFPYIWTPIKKLYLLFSTLFMMTIFLVFFERLFDAEKISFYYPFLLFGYICLFVFQLFIGIYGNKFALDSLLKRGFKIEKSYMAHNKDDFLAKINTESDGIGSVRDEVEELTEYYVDDENIQVEDFGESIKKLNLLGYNISREKGKRIIEHPNGTGKIFCYSRKEYEDRINSILEFHEKHEL